MEIFIDDNDRERFIRTLVYYQQTYVEKKLSLNGFNVEDKKPPYLFDIISYSLMPNHFHLALKDNRGDGISVGLGKALNSYTRYFNTRHGRVGPLFQGSFKAAEITSDEYLFQIVRYIILNPVVAKIVDDPNKYPWSSYKDHISQSKKICNDEIVSENFREVSNFRKFLIDYMEYAQKLHSLKKILLDAEQ